MISLSLFLSVLFLPSANPPVFELLCYKFDDELLESDKRSDFSVAQSDGMPGSFYLSWCSLVRAPLWRVDRGSVVLRSDAMRMTTASQG